MTYFNWPVIETTVFAEMPAELRRPVPTEWSRANKGGAPVDCFLEGPCWDAQGNLWLVDIPHGRILRVSPRGDWAVVADGVWSQLRQQLLVDGSVQPTGHLAYRTLLRQADLPVHLRSQDVTVWMGQIKHRFHRRHTMLASGCKERECSD